MEEAQTIEVTETPQETAESSTEQAVTTENAEPSTQTPEKTFTQRELDEIIQRRLERERETVSKKAAQEARDAYIAEQNYEWNGKKITTESEYRQALQEKELMDKYQEQGLPEDVVRELVESKKFREEYTRQQQESERRAKQESDYKRFLDTFPDVDPKNIPATVWTDVEQGSSLVDAYTRFENQTLKEQLSKLTEQQKVKEQNAENAASTTGSVTGNNDSTGKPYFTPEQVEKMSQAELNKNWNAIMESQKQWYK